jgi:hypothetical protein
MTGVVAGNVGTLRKGSENGFGLFSAKLGGVEGDATNAGSDSSGWDR